jgi:DNA phosphorothioation-associated putative methyltransferase
VAGWDPVHLHEGKRSISDVVNLGYVINVIESPEERRRCLLQAWESARRLLVVSARLSEEMRFLASETPFEDGCLTEAGTFQKFYAPSELRSWIDETLGVQCVVAAPGIVYVFRDASLEQSYLAARYRQRSATPQPRISDVLFEQHRALLDPLMRFVSDRGRLPVESELPESGDICATLGSLKRAFALVRRVTGPEQWDTIRKRRRDDLLIYTALTRFSKRPRYSELSADLQRDVRAHAGTYSSLCTDADALLFSAGNLESIRVAARASSVGKKLPAALYVHVSAISHLPPILRVYEGCARAYVGAMDAANLIKLHYDSPQVTYLAYPDFENDAHPALAGYLLVPLQGQSLRYCDYGNSNNPPILHRKEQFIHSSHPLRATFAALTKEEIDAGLYAEPSRIGTRLGWARALSAHGCAIVDHVLHRDQGEPGAGEISDPESTTRSPCVELRSGLQH